jgi:glycogen(starch) synthase
MTAEIKPKAGFLIEISHEVANSIGGVYTVITTKSKEMRKYYDDNFYAVGPYYKRSATVEFEEHTPDEEIMRVFEELKKIKIICHYGKWLIPGNPKTFLVDFSKRLELLEKIKKRMKKEYSVDCITTGEKLWQHNIHSPRVDTRDINLQLVWGDAAVELTKRLLQSQLFKNKLGVLQFHFAEPSAILAADLIKKNHRVGLVATAHSTRLGRAIAINKEDLFNEIQKAKKKNKVVGKKREYKYGGRIIPLHQFECLLAKNVDVLTTVSDVVAEEVRYILGRKADIVTPNGLDVSSFPSLEERAELHLHAKNRIYSFLNAYFSPYYPIDVKDDLLFFTSGRYELNTKGYAIFFRALGKLNKILQKENYPNNIFAFLFIMMDRKEPNHEILENLAVYDAIQHEVEKEFPHIRNRVMNILLHGHALKREAIFDEDFLINTKKLMLKFTQEKHDAPPICAFKGLKQNDPLLKDLIASELTNKREDKVKVIFYPAPVSVADGLLSMEYFYVISGMHLGVFPSIYEPWGYTPLETAAHSVMSITTDIAGFGKFISHYRDQRKKQGIMVLRAKGRKHDDIVEELTKLLHSICKLSRKERIERKLDAYNLAQLADWKELAKEYIKAHNLAIERCKARQKSKKK